MHVRNIFSRGDNRVNIFAHEGFVFNICEGEGGPRHEKDDAAHHDTVIEDWP